MTTKTNVSDDNSTDPQTTRVHEDDPEDVHARTPIYVPAGHNGHDTVHTEPTCPYLTHATNQYGPRPRGRYPEWTVCKSCAGELSNQGRRNTHTLADLLADPDVHSIEDAREKRDQYAIKPGETTTNDADDDKGELATDGGRRSLVKAFRGPGDDYVTTFEDAEPCAECGKENAGVRAPDDRALCATCYTDATENGGGSE